MNISLYGRHFILISLLKVNDVRLNLNEVGIKAISLHTSF